MTPDASALLAKDMSRSQLEIAKICDEIKDLLISKNAKYGDSALNPSRIFSNASAVEQILVRIDDKLSRIQKGAGLIADDEDVINDLIGYLILLKIAQKNEKSKQDELEEILYNKKEPFIWQTSRNPFDNEDIWDGTDIDVPLSYYSDKFILRCPD